ncbi:MAG TPA: zf-HC2 domain-containing protein [Spirochaetota bacterium]
MKCTDIHALIDDYLDGDLDARRAKEFESHCGKCKACADELSFAKKIRMKLRTVPVVRAPRDFEKRLARRIAGESKKKKTLSRIFFYSMRIKLPLGAAAVLLIGLTLFLIPKNGEKFQPGMMPQKSESVIADHEKNDEQKSVQSAKIKPGPAAQRSISPVANEKALRKDDSALMRKEQELQNAPQESEKDEDTMRSAPAVLKDELQVDKSAERSSDAKKKGIAAAGAEGKVASKTELSADDRPDRMMRVRGIVASTGGSIVGPVAGRSASSESVRNKSETQRSEKLRVRIPSDRYDELMKKLSAVDGVSVPETKPPVRDGFIECEISVQKKGE